MLKPNHYGHHRHHVRHLRRSEYDADRQPSSRIPGLLRSVAVSVAMAALNRWLHAMSEPRIVEHANATAPDLHLPKPALD
jgi:hypothetical protein